MKRAWMVSAVLLIGGMTATGCGSSPSATPATTTTSAPPSTGSALAWLSAKARPWNKKLNDDQAAVITASKSTSETDAASFFGRLASVCTRLRDDALRAQKVRPAPSGSLAKAWQSMAVHTEGYASDCLALTRTHSNAALTRWDESLKSMDSANATLNAAVAVVRGTTGAPAG